ncbi:flavin mononucleotide hydrolase 1, chloroplatic [Andrographis paniculata]|uniref:flavin mononucleotide hydrolase 1, chloroplatic n=1 Tax=Andrographis paniculata TaxID=175694 RepID=UPI0021E799F4|nr:flavin mononucleotide hydrolase 1, chloroplatic [Andrographis paniculata]XP_051138417.1 flavin mononucleotide hydrolase 1, chloroplatic [Andrographis paniculata]
MAALSLRFVWRFGASPMVKLDAQRPPSTSSYAANEMPLSIQTRTAGGATAAISNLNSAQQTTSRKLPILLFDIMDTLVRDPFYDDIPAFFGMSMKELLECKHPTAWIEFEKGHINEMELAQIFFKDGRPIDLEGLKSCMRQGYSYIKGVEGLLVDLKSSGYEMHTATNYPIWYEIIEEKLKLSTYISWTFCSCIMGKRKPDPEFYTDILKHLKVDPACCVFIDDRAKNVDAAADAGFIGIQFNDADSLREDLSRLGILSGGTS